jgi:hypothetical protein
MPLLPGVVVQRFRGASMPSLTRWRDGYRAPAFISSAMWSAWRIASATMVKSGSPPRRS